jgi:NitT/TauT family transport system substrate-binding protein
MEARMRKYIWVIGFLFVLLNVSITAETKPLRVGTLAGVSGLAMVKMMAEPNVAVHYSFAVYKSPELLTAKVIAGEVDLAALPVNSAALLYNKGVPVRLTAIIGWGVLYLVSDDRSLKSWQSLKGKEVYVAGKGAVSDLLFQYLAMQNGIDPARDLKIQYMAPAELAQFAAAGKVRYAVLPEPWVSEALLRNSKLRVALDFQQEWRRLEHGRLTYPQTGLIVRQALLYERPAAVNSFLKDLESSIRWIGANPKQGGVLAERYIQISAGAVRKGLPRYNLHYIDANRARPEVNLFLERLGKMAPEAIGGKLPDAEFIDQP